jgi:hypothetical protein
MNCWKKGRIMKSDCQKIKDQIADLVTGILSEAQVHELEQHLNECAACRDYARVLKDEDMLLTEFFAKIDTDMTRRQERVLQTVNRSCLSKQTDTLSIRRIIMKNPITKLTVAAAVIAVVVLGLFEFLGTGSSSGVVWAEVAQKVEASRGVIFRSRGTGMGDPNDDWPKSYVMHYKSPLHSRTDWYRGEQIRRTVHFDLSTKTVVWLAHDANVYAKEPMKEETVQSIQSGQSGWMHPEDVTTRFVSHEHMNVGTQTIDGVLCDGIETRDPAVFGANYPVKTFVGRLWVSVETGYPVLMEAEVAAGEDGSVRQTVFVDQFEWDVEFSPSDREISIPPGFRPLE